MIIVEPKNLMEAWFQSKTGVKHEVDRCSYVGMINADHKVLAVLIFHSWEGRSVEVDVPPCRLPRALLRASLRYVNQIKCDRVTFKFRADNDRSRKAAERLGARQEGCIRRFYADGCAQLVYGLLKEDYPIV